MVKFTVTICETRYFYTDVELEAESEEKLEELSEDELIKLTEDADWEPNLDYSEYEVTDLKRS